MFRNFVKLFALIFVIGLAAACSSTNPLVSDAQDNIESQNFQAALEAAEQAISEYPDDPLGYYYKAVALGNLGEEQPATERQDYYQRMNETFEKAREVASQIEEQGDVPEELNNITFVKDAIWRTEHNDGIAYATDDSLINATENHLEVSIAHFRNATTIWPDSLLSWDIMSQVYAMQGSLDQAVELKGKVMDDPDFSADSLDYALYGQWLYQAGRLQEAIPVLEEGNEQYPEARQIRQLLADLYMETGQADQAISTVRDLVEEEPDNPQYRLSLGTQIYQAALAFSDSLDANVEEVFNIRQQARDQEITADEADSMITEIEQKNKELRQILEERSEQAIEQLEMVLEQQPNNEQALNAMGVIHQNWAAALFDERNLAQDSDRVSELDQQGRNHLKEAMGYYEKAAEINPSETSYWESLFSIYTTLGMDEEAQEAAEKAGIGNNR